MISCVLRLTLLYEVFYSESVVAEETTLKTPCFPLQIRAGSTGSVQCSRKPF